MGTIPYWPTNPANTRPNTGLTINLAKATQVLSMIDLNKNKAFKGGSKAPDKRLWKLLCAVSEILDWFYTNLPSHEYTEQIANYLWSLLTPYQIAAEKSLGNGTGIVIDPQTGTPLSLQPYREDFIIGGTPAPRYSFAQGDTSYTVPLNGFVIAFIEPSGINAEIGLGGAGLTSITYQPNFVRFNLNQAVVNGEQYTVWGIRSGNITSVPSGGVQLPQPYQAGKFLTNDGTDLKWDDVWIPITAADFESDGRTYVNSTLDGYYLKVVWENLPKELDFEAGEATLIDGGGFIVNLDDFDATQNPDWRFTIYKKSL